jgi:chaperone required for assembly of F1-ATPase
MSDNDNTPLTSAERARRASDMTKPLPKRFYKDVSVSDGDAHQILLDGRAIKTPGKRSLSVPTRALAEAIAAEWVAQEVVINPATMPLTKFANTAIDAVSDRIDEVAADLVAYAGSDLVCYRAHGPTELVVLQQRHWDPVVAWAREALGAHFAVVDGVMPIEQSAEALEPFAAALKPHDAFRLTGQHVLTTLTGSALLTLAHMRGFLSADDAWTAAHADEDYQIALWGEDDEASERRKIRRAEFDAACRWVDLLSI